MTKIEIIRASKFEESKASDAPIFKGTVVAQKQEALANALIEMKNQSHLCSVVSFARGSHTHWHTHTSTQILIITEGEGRVGDQMTEHAVGLGDIAIIPAGVEHYHGAGETEIFTHLMIMEGPTHISREITIWPLEK